MVGIVPTIQTRGILAVAFWKILWKIVMISQPSGMKVTIILTMIGKGSNPLPPFLVRRMTSNFYFFANFHSQQRPVKFSRPSAIFVPMSNFQMSCE